LRGGRDWERVGGLGWVTRIAFARELYPCAFLFILVPSLLVLAPVGGFEGAYIFGARHTWHLEMGNREMKGDFGDMARTDRSRRPAAVGRPESWLLGSSPLLRLVIRDDPGGGILFDVLATPIRQTTKRSFGENRSQGDDDPCPSSLSPLGPRQAASWSQRNIYTLAGAKWASQKPPSLPIAPRF